MVADQHTKTFLGIITGIGVCLVLILSMMFLGGCVFQHFRKDVRRNTIDELTLGNSKTDELSWLHDVKTYNAGEHRRNGHPYPKDIVKRDLGHYSPSKMLEKSLKKYRNPNRARAMNLKKHGNEGKHGFDDSYFLGPETSCRVPEGLETIDIRCKMWPTYKRCISYCVYGSTFDEGIQREHSCTYKENKWSKNFDECKPFVNCKVQLKSPGNVKCYDNELSTKPYCDIYCEIHEDKDEVKTQSYHCNANATWTPPLPFCAQPRDKVPLVKAPAVIEHTVFKYPEAYKKPATN